MPGSRMRKRRPAAFRLLEIRPSTLMHKSRHNRNRADRAWLGVFAIVVVVLILAFLYLWYEG